MIKEDSVSPCDVYQVYSRNLCGYEKQVCKRYNAVRMVAALQTNFYIVGTMQTNFSGSCLFASFAQGGDFDDLYPDVCVEGLEKDPF